ncbi:hypothetical protein B0O80DRAFT_426350 [Mortierella sp. GBAus27b]|nr:hypothetical protein BGX31_006499 [Mortierella sp. GBA43]KAI8354302.1 hypothetical protein B0O80DRAFT_426350 [Mortierella sp. GBAus27b]
MANQQADNTLHVLIVGAGIGGLFLATLLERARIPYAIFERAPVVKPLGAVMSLNVNTMPVFEQLGLFEDLMKASFITNSMRIYGEDLKEIMHSRSTDFKERVGYDNVIFSRPRFYDLLLSQIPPEKIHFGKKVLSIKQLGEDGVSINCSDNTTYTGDILVGADGAYSGVRQSLYKTLEEKGMLPSSDLQGFRIGYMTMVGTTDPLDENKYPQLKDNFCHFHFIIGKGKPYTWHIFTVPDKKICWGVQVQLKNSNGLDMAFRNTEWGPEGNENMIKEVYDFVTPYGPLGQFIDATPRERISKVFLEEKLFDTWYHGRTVLIGDAAHKMSPSQGLGAVNALQDAIILANYLYEIADSPTDKNISRAFRDYKDERYPRVQAQFKASKVMGRVLFGQKLSDRFLRNVLMRMLPQSLMNKEAIKAATYRPQCTYLPRTPHRGTEPAQPQKSSRRYRDEQTRSHL